jgi:hypothetical protein
MVKKIQKAFKAMTIRGDGKYQCEDFIYEISKTYTYKGVLRMCESGFHCCPNASDVYNYYTFGDNTEVMEVEIPTKAAIKKDGNKWCVDIIKIIGPVEDKSFNNGTDNVGHSNTGDWNTGDWNTGHRNTGDWNTGDRNTGHWNTGHWNTAKFQTGFFNTIEQPVSLFNGRATITRQEFLNHKGYKALMSVPLKLTKWVKNKDLPDDQKVGEYTEGKTVSVAWEEAHKEWWGNMSAPNKRLVETLPGFCPEIFREITGIDIKKGK